MESQGFLIPAPGRREEAGDGASLGAPATPRVERALPRAAEDDLRQVAETLSRTGKVLSAGLAQANEQGQRLRGAISRLERANEWSTAERKRAEDEISAFFNNLREVLRAKEDELLRDSRGVYAVQDEDNKRRLEELVIQGQKLSKACMAIQALHEGTSNATIGSLNTPLNALLESLETSGRILEREDEAAQTEAARLAASQRGRPATTDVGASGHEERGVKLHFCNDQTIQRAVESIEMVQFDGVVPQVVLLGTPEAIAEEARRRKLSRGEGQRVHTDSLSDNLNGMRLGGGGGGGEYAASRQSAASAGSPAHHHASYRSFPPSAGGADLHMPRAQSAGPASRAGGSESGQHMQQSQPPPQQPQQQQHQLHVKAVVPYDSEGNNKGVIHYLGRKGDTEDFSNPALFSPESPHLIVLRASSRIEGDLASLAGFRHENGAFFETDSALSSWVSVELPGMLAPTHYSLGYFISGQDHVPRNWVLQGSKDNLTWATLKVHENDAALDGGDHLATWRIPESALSAGPFRYFRVMQTGPTSTGTMFLVLSFIELYGTLYEAAPQD